MLDKVYQTSLNFFLITMVLKLYGNSEIGVHVRSNLCYLIYLRHFIGSRTGTNRIFPGKKTFFLHACATFFELASHVSTMDPAIFPPLSLVGLVSQGGSQSCIAKPLVLIIFLIGDYAYV